MKTQGMRGRGPLAAGCAGLLAVHAAGPAQFAPGELTTATGALARRDAFNEAELCGTCHLRS